jgi:hypothetical protein
MYNGVIYLSDQVIDSGCTVIESVTSDVLPNIHKWQLIAGVQV